MPNNSNYVPITQTDLHWIVIANQLVCIVKKYIYRISNKDIHSNIPDSIMIMAKPPTIKRENEEEGYLNGEWRNWNNEKNNYQFSDID